MEGDYYRIIETLRYQNYGILSKIKNSIEISLDQKALFQLFFKLLAMAKIEICSCCFLLQRNCI